MTTETRRRSTKKDIPEQHAQHVYYGSIPPRASAAQAVTEEPPASSHHLDDTPRTIGGRQPPPQQRPPNSRPVLPPRTHEEEDDDDIPAYPQRPPSSARRYKQPGPYADARPARRSRSQGKGFYTLIVGGSVLAGICIALLVPPLWQRGYDQAVYSYPRISQYDENVGHGTKQYPDDHFIAINNHGYVEVLEIPEGVPDKKNPPQIYLVAQPDGPDADQAPATLEFRDVNGDGKTDIIVHCNGNEEILYNTGSTYKQTP